MSDSEAPRTTARRTRSVIPAALVIVSAVLIGAASSQLARAQRDPSSSGDLDPSIIGIHSTQHGSGLPPGVANLDPDLLGAVRQAATDAAGDEVEFYVNSGWRSTEYQAQLLRNAVSEYGSEEEASRWVATPETSVHVSGDAVDIGPTEAAEWLSDHGSEYGLCQIYRNEPWHYELRPDAIDHGCPPMYDDPTHDPRMQQ